MVPSVRVVHLLRERSRGNLVGTHGRGSAVRVRTAALARMARKGAHGRAWYRDAGKVVARIGVLGRADTGYVADILAITSPRVQITRNVALTLEYLRTGAVTGALPMVVKCLEKYRACGDISGPKTRAFAECLRGNTHAVVIDVWIIRALGLAPNVSLSRRAYFDAAGHILETAHVLRWTPAETQAAIWCAIRAEHGRQSHSLPFPKESIDAR